MLAGGLIAGVASTIANAAVKDVTYTVITDLQISERNYGKEASKADWTRYKTRIMSTANKANLKFKDALPALEDGLSKSIVGMF